MSNQVWPWFTAKEGKIAKGEEIRWTSEKERAVEGGNRREKEGIGGRKEGIEERRRE